jgi:broad specificity phosphatase PhoE
MTRIILVRHGQTEWNRIERFRGRADVPLNAAGLVQAQLTGRRIAAEWQPSAVYSSPLSRAVKTAEVIAGYFDFPVQIDSGLIDIDYGQWKGLTPDEVRERWPKMIDDWYNKPASLHIPDGETLEELRSRALVTMDKLIACHKTQTIVVVGHTVINRVILLSVLGLSNDRFWRLHQDTCAINCFEEEGGDFTLVSLNDTCHLRFKV